MKNKGITLIALIITIIIMLILVAVSVSYGIKSGLLSKAKEGTAGYKYKEEEEKIGEILLSSKVDEETGKTNDTLDQYLEKELSGEADVEQVNGEIIVTYKNTKNKHKIEEINNVNLSKKYIPITPTNISKYPISTKNIMVFLSYNRWYGYSLDQSGSHAGTYWDNTSGSSSFNFKASPNATYHISHTFNEIAINRIAEYNDLFPTTEIRKITYPITMYYNASGGLNFTFTTSSTCKSIIIQFSSTYFNSIMEQLVLTENDYDWIPVKDKINNTYGYYCEKTNEYYVVADLTGEEI